MARRLCSDRMLPVNSIDRKELFAWGANNCGQLGRGTTLDILLPVQIHTSIAETDWIQFIGGGGGFSLLLTGAGLLFACGNNERGQLAKKEKENVLTFSPRSSALPGFKLTKVASGWDFALAITDNGTVFSWGSNAFGQLGRQTVGGHSSAATPDKVTFCEEETSQALDIGAGLRHSILLTDAGHIFTWGHGKKGQLGTTGLDGSQPAKLDVPTRVDTSASEKAVRVVAGMYHTGCLTALGVLFLWGCNKYGQCSLEPKAVPEVMTPTKVTFPCGETRGRDPVVEVTSGWTHLLGRTANGQLYSWGRADLGQLGRPSGTGGPCDHVPTLIEGLTDVRSQACGSEHSLALNGSGQVFAWGWNEHGICGTGDEVNVLSPTRIPAFIDRTVADIGCGAGHSFCLL